MVNSFSTAHTFIVCGKFGQYSVFLSKVFSLFESLILRKIINIFPCIFPEFMQARSFFHFHSFPILRNLMEFKLELFSKQITVVIHSMSPLKQFPMLHRLSVHVSFFTRSLAQLLCAFGYCTSCCLSRIYLQWRDVEQCAFVKFACGK